ncbi:MAG: beta-ketoacyl synthase chain length factor [Prolixibacteraceae bacterium]|nr:beta-ketoacyl synthase chain length factor [Prolixibacteraceae bacterium]
MGIYIKSSESISSQDTFDKKEVLIDIINHDGDYQQCILPDFKQYIDAKLLRRMSKILKMGVSSAKSCLGKAGLEVPDAILVGTGLGCINDTAKFLNLIIDNDEQLLNPTPFIQSTHNTISGQIALLIKCKKYNLTFTQKTISFETALLDASMLLKDNVATNALVGGVDEMNNLAFELIKASGCESSGHSSEGSTFFVLSNEKGASTVELTDVTIINRVRDLVDLQNQLSQFLSRSNLKFDDVDVVVSGMTGDAKGDGSYKEVNGWFSKSNITKYKHLVGDYYTASAFGIFLANDLLANNRIPESVVATKVSRPSIKRVLVFNHSMDKDFSFVLLSKC